MTESDDLALYAAELYELGKYDELFELAERLSEPSEELEPNRAEVFRFARVVSVRRHDRVGTELWGARAWTAAMLTGSNNVAAALLLPHFFVLVELGAFQEARGVLDGLLSLIDDGAPSVQPSATLLHRLYEEKAAFSFLAEGRYSDAEKCYERALIYAGTLRRAGLKIRGGLALVKYLSNPGSSEVARAIEREMRSIAGEAIEHGYVDVIGWATENVEIISQGKTEGWVPFEQT
jgi:tetratricopeptide (TPR) repeat protein